MTKLNQGLAEKLNTQKMVDGSRLSELFDCLGEEMEVMEELASMYESLLPESLKDIQENLEVKSADGLKAAAHKLKSSSYNLGLRRIGTICEWLEAQASQKSIASVQGEMEALLFETKQIHIELKNALDELRKAHD